jgi:hypothetical protein
VHLLGEGGDGGVGVLGEVFGPGSQLTVCAVAGEQFLSRRL